MSYLTANGSQQSTPTHHVAPNARLAKHPRTTTQGLDEARSPALTQDLTQDQLGDCLKDSQDTQILKTQATNAQNHSTNAQAPANKATTLVPFPRRPGARTAEESVQEEALIDRSSAIANEYKSGSLDTPHESYKYAGGKCADFNPWIGGHPEDILSEQTIKGGFQNKPAVTNETNTARPSLWNHLKSKQGTGTLSSLFVAVLEKRQAAGRVSAPSTFKLPPRVTLTGTRREAWLSDLANSSVPLRKLSRTIPHGVNGKALLEQCLGKTIPAPRAIWLIKCVGANELRAFKRKGAVGVSGASGESKWTREWTCHLEQFIEGVLATCGEPGWSDKVQYVIRLAVNIFNERLLDHEHYLSWILDSMRQASFEQLPFWVIMTQIHWKHMVATRRHGKRLAESLLSQLESLATSPAPAMYSSLTRRLGNLLLTLAVAHKGCLLSPALWQRYLAAVREFALATGQIAVNKSMADLTRRNTRLDPQSFHKRFLCSTPRYRVFQLLDCLPLNIDLNNLIAQCRQIVEDIDDFCKILLQWASSVYRNGVHRLYLVARLLRKCRSMDADLEEVIFDFALDLSTDGAFDYGMITKLVAELVRSNHFSTAKFLQLWISSGVAGRGHSASSSATGNHTTRLLNILRSLPLDKLPSHVGNLADILLSGSLEGKSADLAGSDRALHSIISQLQQKCFPIALTPADAALLTSSQKHEISSNARLAVQTHLQSSGKSGRVSLDLGSRIDTDSLFVHARAVIESIEDYPILADIIGMLSTTAGTDLLASLADTLNKHHTIFASIGALRPLASSMRDRYQVLRHTEACAAETIRAMLKVGELLDPQGPFTRQLRVDVARQEQSNAIAMCSPASDNLTEHISGIDTTPEEEIERVLNSGTSMDQPNMVRVFKRLASYALDRHAKSSATDELARVGDWLSRLQSFDRPSFDILMSNWVKQLLVGNRPMMIKLLPYIVGTECCTVMSLMQALDVVASDRSSPQAVNANLDILGYLFFYEPLPMTSHSRQSLDDASAALFQKKVLYRAHLEIDRYIEVNAASMLTRFASLRSACQSESELLERMARISCSPRCRNIVKDIIINDPARLVTLISDGRSDALADVLSISLDEQALSLGRSSNISHSIGQSSMDTADDISQAPEDLQRILLTTDELSLPFHKARLHCMFSSIGDPPKFGSLASEYLATLPAMMHGQCPVWADLLISLGPEFKQTMQSLAASRLAQFSADKDCQMEVTGSATLSAQDLLDVVDCCYDVPSAGNRSSSGLAGCVRDSLAEGRGSDADGSIRDDIEVGRQLSIGIHLAVLYPPPASATGVHDERTQCIVRYASMLRSTLLQKQPALFEQVCDLLVILSDDITEEQRLHILRHDAINATDPRIKFILGTLPSADNWLGLVTSTANTITSGPLTPSAIPSPASLNPQRSLQQVRRPTVQPPSAQSSASHLPPRPSTPLQRTNSGLLGQQQQNSAQSQSTQPHQHHYSQKAYNPPIPYTLRKWEVLPDQGPNAGHINASAASSLQPTVNDTSISLTLFGARKVI